YEQLDEPRPVLSFQRKFFVVNNYRIHEFANWVIWKLGNRDPVTPLPTTRSLNYPIWMALAAACPERTALSIVAGNPVSIQSPASSRPRTEVRVCGRGGCPGASENVARGSRMTDVPTSRQVRAAGMASSSSVCA